MARRRSCSSWLALLPALLVSAAAFQTAAADRPSPDDLNARLAAGILADYLPPAPAGWTRSKPETGAADARLFGSGTATRASYRREAEDCGVTITGGSPNMQGVSMTFSNPAVAGFTGNQMKRVGTERVLAKPDGELQAFANNFLVQITGNCTEATRLDLIAKTDLEGLRALSPPAAPAAAPGGAVSSTSSAAALSLQWDRTFGGAGSDWSYAMTGTLDGGLAAAGRTESKGAGREDLWVVRVDDKGARVWDRTYGGAATDRARAIIETRNRDLVVAGATESKGAGEFDVWVLRVDANGKLLWDRHFGGKATDWASAVVETRDGGIAVAAYTQDAPELPYDIWVLKLSADGELIWQQRFGGPATEWASAIAEGRNGELLVAGHTESKGAGDADIWVLKLDTAGRLHWERTYGGAKRDYASAITATDDGGMVVAGPVDSNPAEKLGAGGVDARVIRLDTEGATVWDRTFGGASDDWPRAVLETRDGGHAVSGYTMSKGAGQYDMWLLKLDRAGGLLWEETFGGAANEWARSLVEMPDGGLAMAGDTWSKGAGMADVWVLRLAPPAP